MVQNCKASQFVVIPYIVAQAFIHLSGHGSMTNIFRSIFDLDVPRTVVINNSFTQT